MSRREASLSPYTGLPLRRATGLSYLARERVYRVLHQLNQYDNRLFDLRKAALCRETGRIFPNCVTWYDTIKLDWTFLQKRFPGHFVSWGSLNSDQQAAIKNVHQDMKGFQTMFSCPEPSPRLVDERYVYEKPGPLYVDVNTGTLVGWKCVPDTDLEILIVQKPTEIITLTPPKE